MNSKILKTDVRNMFDLKINYSTTIINENDWDKEMIVI